MLFVLSSATLVAQTPARDRTTPLPVIGTAAIRGRVFVSATNDAVRHAVLTISGGGTRVPAILSDEEGRFQFTALPPATFTIVAAKPGFAKTSATLEVGAGRTVEAPPIALPRGSVLTGSMIDEVGEPVVDSGVLLLRVNPKDDGTAQQLVVGSVYTDDLGAFRFGSLAAGTYSVNPTRLANGVIMSAQPGTDLGQAVMRFRIPDSARYIVQAGEERSGIVIVGLPDRPLMPPPARPSQADAGRPGVQPGDSQTAITVRGRVTRAGGLPLSRAGVQLMSPIPGPPVVSQTDSSGRYELVLPNGRSGDYRIVVRKPGYAFAEYGAPSPDRRGALLRLNAGDSRDDLDVALTKLSSASGRILDDLGEPVEGALVRVAQLRYADGQRKLVDMPPLASRTDDLGRYRISGLRSGQYALIAAVGQVVVTEAAAEFPGYGTSYFPGTANANEIQLLSVGAAQDLTDLDFRLVRQKSFMIAGHAADSEGNPVTGGITLTPRRRSGAIAAVQMGARIDREGGFEFLNVPPGEYVVQVTRGMGRNAFSEGEFAYRFVDIVDGDVKDLDIQTGLGSTITGRLIFDGGEPPPLERLELSAMPVDLDRTPGGQTARARINPEDYTFELARINGPRRIQVMQPPSGWMLKGVVINGVDVTDEPLAFGRDDQSLDGVEVLLTNRATRLAGRIPETRDVSVTDLGVLVFSTRRDQWYLNTRYIRRSSARSDGSFSFEGLPPGEYYVMAAYPPDDPGAWRDPEVLERLALQATRTRLSEGQQISVDVRPR
jgi:protocatechuate 3,4-dioxygenase beta subunit